MATDFTLPELGENIVGGDVVRVLVSAGDSVTKDQPVLELETDKATIEVPSSVSGTVKEVRIKQGERVKVGQVVLTLDNGAAAATGKREERGRRSAEAPAGRRRRRRWAQPANARRRHRPASSGSRSEAQAWRGCRHPGRRAHRSARPAGSGTQKTRMSRPSHRARRRLPRLRCVVSRANLASISGASRAAARPGASAPTTCRRSSARRWREADRRARPRRCPISPSGVRSSASR